MKRRCLRADAAGLRAQMIGAAARSWTRWVSRTWGPQGRPPRAHGGIPSRSARRRRTRVPQRLTDKLAQRPDIVVTMGCGCIAWELTDPAGQPRDAVRPIRGRNRHPNPGTTSPPESNTSHANSQPPAETATATPTRASDRPRRASATSVRLLPPEGGPQGILLLNAQLGSAMWVWVRGHFESGVRGVYRRLKSRRP